MLSKNQYKFLKKFLKQCEKSVQEDSICKEFNRKMLKDIKMYELLANDRSLFKFDPFESVNEDDNFIPGTGLDIIHIDNFLVNGGLNEFITHENKYYRPTISLQQAMEEYRNYRLKNIFSIISLIFSFIAIIISIFAIIYRNK